MDREAIQAQQQERKQREEAEKEAERIWGASLAPCFAHFCGRRLTRAARPPSTAEQQSRAQLALQQREAERQQAETAQRHRLLASWEQQAAEARARKQREKEEAMRAVRHGPEDRTLGPSSAQVFDGEDVHAAERRRMQALQQRRWVAQQQAEKESEARQRREEEERYARDLLAMEATREELEQQQQREAQQQRDRAAAENEALLRAQAARAQREAHRERREAQAQQEALARDPMLNEDESRRASALGPHRIRVDHFKGMTEEERAEVERQRAAQLEERRRQREEEAEEDRVSEALRALSAVLRHPRSQSGCRPPLGADLGPGGHAGGAVRRPAGPRAGAGAGQGHGAAAGHAAAAGASAEAAVRCGAALGDETPTLTLRGCACRNEERKERSTNAVTAGFFDRFGTSER